MEKLILAKEGVFPVTKDWHGGLLEDTPKTGLQIAGTIQGEGKLAGVPSLFIRLSGCNLRCIWQMEDGTYSRCDTRYASFQPNETIELEVDQVVDWVKHNIGNIKHVVITGGEPLLQRRGVADLCQKLKEQLNVHITVESNGSIFDEEVAKGVDLFSISPKLSNSVPSPEKLAIFGLKENAVFKKHNQKRLNIEALQSYIDLANSSNKELQLKFVVGRKNDFKEILSDFINQLNNCKPSDILLMPLGATKVEISRSAPMVLDMAIANGWRFSPRVHIELFGSKSGV
ncbi:7-carboxy-7-deazaguanine synthase QueE [Carboxylicivirga sp. M1479]|uniref:7-carboxy-7-deazaguanine synthase QueE n=1 Tax=Carboxylicivirga sp. M1479 TaxID=2594476 RepID=UPI0011785C97|nr:7-carboxy-7-deazaguanine synthase QueE [Carboxylicivirga sp. M1479]TRX70915.1 7-carboxy-7-deazaguanine synthase QueE [Carboxylicivirga sp. M1479]